MNPRPPPTKPETSGNVESEQPTKPLPPDTDPTLELLAAEASRRTVAHELRASLEWGTLYGGTEVRSGARARTVAVPAVESTLLDRFLDDEEEALEPIEAEEAPPSGVIPVFRL